MGKDHIDHDTQAIICGEHPHRRGESSRPVLLHVGAVEAEEDPLPGGSGAGGVGTRLGSPHCTSHAQGGGRPDARLHLARLWGRRTGMARGGWAGGGPPGNLSSTRVLSSEGRKEEGKARRIQLWLRKVLGELPQQISLVTRTEMVSPGKEEDRDGVSQRLIGKWRVYKQGKQDPVAGGFFLVVSTFFMWW